MWKKETEEKDNEKGIQKYENEKAQKVKNELKLNVNEQQDAIKLGKRILSSRWHRLPWKKRFENKYSVKVH